MSINTKILGVFVAILVVMGVALSFILYSVYSETPKIVQIGTKIEEVSTRSVPLVRAIDNIKLNVVQVQQWLTDISATRGQDGLDDGFAEAENAEKAFNAEMLKAQSNARALNRTEVVSALQEVANAFPAYYETGKRMAAAYVKEGPAGGNKMMSQFDGVAEKMGVALDNLLKVVQRETVTELDQLSAISNEIKDNFNGLIWTAL